MKVITQKEFDNFPVINSCKQCPSGNYTQIKKFEDNCVFGESCKFWEYSEFGKRCHFGDHCEFRRNCSFGEFCKFGNDCFFAEECTFEDGCSFGIWCVFGDLSNFGERCKFGAYSDFRYKCRFENGHVANDGYPLLSFGGFGSVHRTTYFFNCEDGIWVRCGCFFGDIEQFRERVKKTRTGRLGKEYLMIADLVEMKWK